MRGWLRLSIFVCAALLAGALALAVAAPALASPRHPFAVGVNEGTASATGLGGWILAQESWFSRLLSGAVRAMKTGASNGFALAALSFGYGVFHAAGPGHGKAVVAAYMAADERRLRRGLVVSAAAAALQGLVAVALVGTALLIIGAGARRMTAAARWIEVLSYAGVVALGATLLIAKARGLYAAARPATPGGALAAFGPMQPAGAGSGRFAAGAGAHVHDATCGHLLGPDVGETDRGFSLRAALLTIAAAGSRPCSGAILVLVFASAQGVFLAGVGAVAAMSAGVAVTTGLLASSVVFAKRTATRLLGAQSRRALIAGRAFEAGAALVVLLFGLALLAGALGGHDFGG